MEKITLGLNERMRVSKLYVDWCHNKRIDVQPTTLLGWLEAKGYLNAEAIRADLRHEQEELKNV